MDSEELQHLHTLRAKYVRNLHRLQEQEADYGLNVPLEITNNITKFEDLIQKIDIEMQLISVASIQSVQLATRIDKDSPISSRKYWLLILLIVVFLGTILSIFIFEPTLLNNFGLFQEPVFKLKNPNLAMFYPLNNAAVTIDGDHINVKGKYDQGVYIGKRMPENFICKINFVTHDPDSQFIIGLSDGFEHSKNISLMINSSSSNLFVEKNYPIFYNNQNDFHIIPNKTFNVTFERNDGVLKILVNDNLFVTYPVNVDIVNKYNYIFLTSTIDITVNGNRSIAPGEFTVLDLDIVQGTR